MPLGKSVQKQRGFVRRVGMTPSAADRQNKRVPVTRIEEQKDGEQKAKLKAFAETHPELHVEAGKFVRRFDYTEEEATTMTVRYIENAIKELQRKQHEDALLETYHKRKAERVRA